MKIRSIMVTGNNWGTASSIAREVGIGSVIIAEAKPELKAKKVKDLQLKLLHRNILQETKVSFATMNCRGCYGCVLCQCCLLFSVVEILQETMEAGPP
ncbi:hypothetical protein RJT34_18518 [Clitoria ternatea]|uniref:Uncharacterized protein n=1 Tax=Clitoria ternatea TaxID=43366 RepID=A0AAN9PFX2_CLITE